jgi:chaperonin cofactor prefoldin
MIAALEAKLEEARNKATEKVKTDIEKLHEKRATLVEREQKIAAQILSVDEQIAALVAGEASTTQLTFTATEAEEV